MSQRSTLRTAIKKVRKAIEAGDKTAAQAVFKASQPVIDSIADKNIVHENLAVASASVAYVAGAHVSSQWPAEQVICWVLIFALPLTLPAACWLWPVAGQAARVEPSSWAALVFVSVFSMWLGFYAWYRGLALGGVMRVSQVQLLQPFLSLMFAVPVLGERLDPVTVLFALAVMAVVLLGRRMPVGARSRPETRSTVPASISSRANSTAARWSYRRGSRCGLTTTRTAWRNVCSSRNIAST